ncbi:MULTISPECIES: ATP-binding cassette domain-containing protein [Prevotellaceae]|uniref:ATP-binding cassette domain-containing protein n=1 Tax=Xylanibacter rarus TaxID=1676614 RepID=UPI00257B90B8|nr:ATP-binding cassette domain-containing protein [Prevotella sp.]MBS5876332.1 ATP-binding cassette domain-containing protein [Prevotella sp.]
MKEIIFNSVIPDVFSHSNTLNSDVWNSDVVFNKEQLYLIEADSGKGKSTFCSYILGYRRDYSGNIKFDNKSVREMKISEWIDIRKLHISYLFQELRLFPELTAFENVEIKNKLTNFKNKQQILEWFEILGIGDKVNSKICHMSFGQQQRVAMIRALVQPFDFILVDEPISHLDDNNSKIMGDIMMTEAKAQGAGVIVTSIGKHMNLNYNKVFKL